MGKVILAALMAMALASAGVLSWTPTAWQVRAGAEIGAAVQAVGRDLGVSVHAPQVAAPAAAPKRKSASVNTTGTVPVTVIPDPSNPDWFAQHSVQVQVCNGTSCQQAYLLTLPDGQQVTIPASIPGGVLQYACQEENIPSGQDGCP